MKKQAEEKKTERAADCCFEGYDGRNKWTVRHPKHKKTLVVMAKDEACAIVAAAQYWGERWQAYSFYPYCEVMPYRGAALENGEGG